MNYFFLYDFLGKSTLTISVSKDDLKNGFSKALLYADFELSSDYEYILGELGIEPILMRHKRRTKNNDKALNLKFSGDSLVFGIRALEIFAENSPENSDALAIVEQIKKLEYGISDYLN
jgi:hypothetical protein